MSENDIKTLPFDWTITSSADNRGSCPGESLILGSFAAINAVAGIMSLFFGNRKVVKKPTLGLLGTPTAKPGDISGC